MQIVFDSKAATLNKSELILVAAFQPDNKKSKPQVKGFYKDLASQYTKLKTFKGFSAEAGQHLSFTNDKQQTVVVTGLGSKKEFHSENLRKTIAKLFKAINKQVYTQVTIGLDSFQGNLNNDELLYITSEAILLSNYDFGKHKSKTPQVKLKKFVFVHDGVKGASTFNKALTKAKHITESINLTRDLVNEAPNILHSERYAQIIAKDVKEKLPAGVKVKILNKAAIKKEKMNLLLAVNAGSYHEPRLVHLTYTPKKATSKTKHYCLVGKGITFDTGGYSLKPGGSMMGMKFDMGGSATVYGAFRAAVLQGAPHKITCILAMTDNKIGPEGIMPDSIVTSRNGKTVEILNTDAEGRLILADALDYACDLKPNYIIDAATLTGACLVALGKEVCGLMTNDEKIGTVVKKAAKKTDEYIWELPVIPEWRNEIKSHIADIKNIGAGRFAGTAVAAAFLEEFIKNNISYAHLDIAGVCDSQSHLPYCDAKGASGLMVRTLFNVLTDAY
jgi:leucyl aminopeptidase